MVTQKPHDFASDNAPHVSGQRSRRGQEVRLPDLQQEVRVRLPAEDPLVDPQRLPEVPNFS